jgi:hypothetical protein
MLCSSRLALAAAPAFPSREFKNRERHCRAVMHLKETARLKSEISELLKIAHTLEEKGARLSRELSLYKNTKAPVQDMPKPTHETPLSAPTTRGRELLAERREVKCSCSGEVENCFKCSGKGTYMVNGYGNPV